LLLVNNKKKLEAALDRFKKLGKKGGWRDCLPSTWAPSRYHFSDI